MHWKDKLIAHFSQGCFTVLFAASIYLMFHTPRRGTGVNKPTLIISGLMYLSCSTHFALNFYYVFVWATPHWSHAITNTAQVATGFNVSTEAIADLDFMLNLLIPITNFICELILVYRCWVLWSRKYLVIILPSLISITSIGEALVIMKAS